MRIRPGVLSLAVLALAALPVAAETARAAPPPAQVSITLSDSSALLDSVSITIAPRYEMSWSKSASGTAAEVREAMKAWAPDVEKVDRQYNTNEDTLRLHQEQVKQCVGAAERFADTVPDGYHFSVEAGGHAQASTAVIHSDQWTVKLGMYKLSPTSAS